MAHNSAFSMFNIAKLDGSIMLGAWLPNKGVVNYWLSYYKEYTGKPYPNGKGFYPDYGYHIVELWGPTCTRRMSGNDT